jgi:hypothetical protein
MGKSKHSENSGQNLFERKPFQTFCSIIFNVILLNGKQEVIPKRTFLAWKTKSFVTEKKHKITANIAVTSLKGCSENFWKNRERRLFGRALSEWVVDVDFSISGSFLPSTQ